MQRKIERHRNSIYMTEEDGLDEANTVVIAYGATARAARHAVKLARQRRHKTGLLVVITVWPFPEEVVCRLAHTAKRIVVPEMNLGQLAIEVERLAGRNKVVRVNRANGEMITPQMILQAIEGH